MSENIYPADRPHIIPILFRRERRELPKVTCTKCGGRGIVPHRHVTNKRNSKPCPECGGTGECEMARDVQLPVL